MRFEGATGSCDPSKEAVKLRGGRGEWSHRNRSGRRDWRVLTSHPTEGASVLAVIETLALSLLASIGSCPGKELVRVKCRGSPLGGTGGDIKKP